MTKLRMVLLTWTAATAVTVGLSGETRSEQRQPSYQYSGVVKAKSEASSLVTVQTRHGLLDFHYPLLVQKPCAALQELKVGDGVQVSSPVGNAPYEASCIKKLTPAGVSR